MEIDDPKAVFEQQYMQEGEKSPLGLTVFASKLAFPKLALPLEIFQKIASRLTRPSIEERVSATWHMFVMETEHLESTKADKEDIQEAIQLALHRDSEEFNDKKRERYVRLIGNALRSEERIQDVTSFVQTIEQLNERDVAVLNVLNKIMNKESDWHSGVDSVLGNIAKLHPSTLIGRAQEFAVQVAMALGQGIEKNTFSREEGYGICNRLQGFGLAHDLQASPRELPLTNYSFRLSVQGIRFLKLLGEDVPNYKYYLPSR